MSDTPETESLRFFEPDWAAALQDVARDDRTVQLAARGVSFTVALRVGTIELVTDIDDGVVRVGLSEADPPGPVNCRLIVSNRDDAWAVHRGAANAQRLLSEGRLRVQGDVLGLSAIRPVLDALSQAWSPLRERTAAI